MRFRICEITARKLLAKIGFDFLRIPLDPPSFEGVGLHLHASHLAQAAAVAAHASFSSGHTAAVVPTASAAMFTLVTTSSFPLVSSGPEVAVFGDPLGVF